MRVAYCVVCHRRSKILDEMIDILGKDNDIYISMLIKKVILMILEIYRIGLN